MEAIKLSSIDLDEVIKFDWELAFSRLMKCIKVNNLSKPLRKEKYILC